MSENTKTTNITDFTKGNVSSQLMIFALPLFLSNLLQVVYNTVDMIIVGKVLGQVGLSAVAIGGDVSSAMTFIVMGFANAAQVIISQYIGSNQRKKLGPFVSTMLTFLLSTALIISIICLTFRRQILIAMNTPAESFGQALSYSTICMAGLVFIYGYNSCSAILRGMGDSKHPFIFVSMAAVTNVILDILFVIVFGMKAGGAALATVISQALSFICAASFLIKNKDKYELTFDGRFIGIRMEYLLPLIKLGVPMAIKSAAIIISKLFVNAYINSYGIVISAFTGIANKLSNVANLISQAFNTSSSSMVGQNLAAEKYDRVGKILITTSVIVAVPMIIFSLLITFAPEVVYGLFTSDPEVIQVGINYIPIAVAMFISNIARASMNGLINGSGNYRINFATAILDGIILRVGLSYLLGLGFGMNEYGFWWGNAIAGYTPFVLGVIFLISGKWKRKPVSMT